MGCGPSRPSRNDIELHSRPARQVTISQPSGGPVQVPPTYRDARGMLIEHAPVELDRDTLFGALSDMAAFLDRRGANVEMVTVGGAVNTLYLESRMSTHDVDFFLDDASSQVHHAIHEAARFANRKRQGNLGAEWLNNATQLMMSRQLQQTLFNAAREQRTVVFEQHGTRGGLLIYAAPWSYAVCGKLNRLSTSDPRSYDLADAVSYLMRYLEAEGRQTVGADRVRRWCERFGKNFTVEALQELDEAFAGTYGYRPIDWDA